MNHEILEWVLLAQQTQEALTQQREIRLETMQPDSTEQQREICYYILSYLSDHPDAGDTLEGIVEWWLLGQKIKFETRNVSEAVARLVSEGLIVEHEKSDSHNLYKVNSAREETIQSALNEMRRRHFHGR